MPWMAWLAVRDDGEKQREKKRSSRVDEPQRRVLKRFFVRDRSTIDAYFILPLKACCIVAGGIAFLLGPHVNN
jgi:hypothetical protein